MFFRYTKNLIARLKIKTAGRNYESSKFTGRITRTDRAKIKRIMVFGDSNSYRPGRSNTSWPNVFNESCDGRTTKFDSGERYGLSIIAEKLIVHTPLDYVVIMLGTNDVKNKYGPPQPTEIAEGMHLILDIIENQGCGAKPILLTPPPIGNVTSGDFSDAKYRISPVAAEYRLLAKKLDIWLIDIHCILKTSTHLESDMVHVNTAGRKKIADTLWVGLNKCILQ